MSDLCALKMSAFERGERQVEIFRRFEDDGVLRQLIFYTIKRYRGIGSITERSQSGRPRTIRTAQLAQRV